MSAIRISKVNQTCEKNPSQWEGLTDACGGMGIADYENVLMERWPNYCAAEHPGTEKRAIIQFKRDVCPNPYIQKKAEP